MSDAYIVRRGGGGAGGLNFKIVGGTTRPGNPKENTIWVNTSQKITGWSFSDVEPQNPQEHIGMIWFMRVGSNTKDFNALSKNEIQVCMSKAMQRISGEWVERETAIYKNGEWLTLWNGVLYDNGVIPPGYCGVHSANIYPSKFSAGIGTFEENRWKYSVSSGQVMGLQTIEKVDITGYKTLRIMSGGVGVRFGLSTDVDAYSTWVATATSTSDSNHEGSIDLSTVADGKYYISAGASKSASGTDVGYVYKFWLE